MFFFTLLFLNYYALNIKVNYENSVHELQLSDYISGVLASEIPISWSDENFLTMSILVRTFVLDKYKKNKNKSFVVRDSVLDQVYKPIDDKDIFERIKKLVLSTDNFVLVDGKKALFKVFYHSSCGGRTELPKNIWGSSETLNQSVKCLYCKKAPSGTWTFKIKESLLKKIFQTKFKIKDFNNFLIKEYTSTGRVKNLLISNSVMEKTISAQKFRELIGFFKIKSTNFKIKKFKNEYIFEGKGFGHGAGLCQWGMKNLIQEGATYKEVLKYYFPKAELMKVDYEHL